jgi:hypothetical protein
VTETRIADCGHEYTPPAGGTGPAGYAVDNNTGRTHCYACDDARERQFMRKEDTVFAYLSRDAKTVATWTGGKLGTVLPGLYWTKGKTPTGGRYESAHFAMRDDDGNEWHGSGAGQNFLVRLRRVKVRTPR